MQNEQNQITGLSLYDCGLKDLPPEIGNLQNLTKLYLGKNQLTLFPKALLDLNLEVNGKLREINLEIEVRFHQIQIPHKRLPLQNIIRRGNPLWLPLT